MRAAQAARGDPVYNANAINVNAITRAWKGLHCDEVCDFGADPFIGPAGSNGVNADYVYDSVHPTMMMQNIMLAIIAPILDAQFAARQAGA